MNLRILIDNETETSPTNIQTNYYDDNEGDEEGHQTADDSDNVADYDDGSKTIKTAPKLNFKGPERYALQDLVLVSRGLRVALVQM